MAARQQGASAHGAQEQILYYGQQQPPPYWHHYHSYSEHSLPSSELLKPTMASFEEKERSGWNPKAWGRGRWCICAILIVVVIVAAVVGAVLGVRSNRYPNYSKLSYSLLDTYEGASFFDNFDYFTGWDPSHGFVHYVDSATAAAMNLTFASATSAILRVDTSDKNATTGRRSVRITSKKQYNSGLFIFDVVQTPYGCSTWPSLWLTDPSNWPFNGEIDVMESVNQATKGNQVTLHTSNNCDMSHKRKETASVLTSNCYNGTDGNAGCGVQGPTDSIGQAFNSNGGGVYAMELRSAGIRVWFFQRSSIPADITSGNSPDPSTWGTAFADFPSTGCDISSHFKNQSIIADIDLCGDWAGADKVYNTQFNCPGTCSDWVATQADSYNTAVWEFNSFKVYQAA